MFLQRETPAAHRYGLHNHLLSDVTLASDYDLAATRVFSKRVEPRGQVTNQASSGRCWMYAALNMLRLPTVTAHGLPTSFEFSQKYLFFWDKLERVNYFLHAYESTKDDAGDSRLVQFLLHEPLGDGGQWQMFVNLVDKYGLVPQSAYPESKHSQNSRGLNMVLTKKLREYARNLRENRAEPTREAMLVETYDLLVRFLGKPPSEFAWEYYDKAGKPQRHDALTPKAFYAQFVGTPLHDTYASVIDDPRNPYDRRYGVEYLNNVVEGREVVHLNKDADTLAGLIKKSIDAGKPVWFGCDVGQFLRSQSAVMDTKVFDMATVLGVSFGLNKRERLEYGESLMTHAMLIVGYNEDRFGCVDRWEIENSWGDKGEGKGYYTMTHEWLREYVYQIAIPRAMLCEADRVLADDETPVHKRYAPWDPMGALALTQ
jgi:bleomycin hydrolase